MKKIELEILLLSHSMAQSHSYAVILGELNGPRRLPIVIGAFEAQSIAIALEKVNPTRPLTHDLVKNICGEFKIEIVEVIINNLQDNIFYAKLVCKHGNGTIEIDSRTSDALALALRFDCPIYTFDFIMDTASIVFEDTGEEPAEKVTPSKADKPTKKTTKSNDLAKFSIQELDDLLKETLENEDYEKAIAIRDEIDKRKKNS